MIVKIRGNRVAVHWPRVWPSMVHRCVQCGDAQPRHFRQAWNSCRQADARRDRAQLAAIARAIEDGAYTHTLKAHLTALEQENAQTEPRFAPPSMRRCCNSIPTSPSSMVSNPVLAEALNALGPSQQSATKAPRAPDTSPPSAMRRPKSRPARSKFDLLLSSTPISHPDFPRGKSPAQGGR